MNKILISFILFFTGSLSASSNVSIPATVCSVTIGKFSATYVRLYEEYSTNVLTCKELGSVISNMKLGKYNDGSVVQGTAGSLSIGKKPNKCRVELNIVNETYVGSLYGNESTCRSFKAYMTK